MLISTTHYKVLFASAERIFEVLDMESEIKEDKDAIDIDLQGNIEFKNVWFKYVEDEWILKRCII